MLVIITYLDIASAVFSTVFNAVLIFLILTKSPSQLGSYKYLMLSIAVFEIAMALLEAVLVPIHYSHGSAVTIMVRISKTQFSHLTALIFLLIFVFFFGASFAIFAVHFIYRYLAVSGNPLIKSFGTWKLILWFMLPCSIGVAWSIMGLFLCYPDQDAHDYLRSSILKDFGESIENFVYILFYPYKHLDNGSFSFNYSPLVALGITSFTVGLSFCLILFFGIKCYRHISNMMKKSTTVSMHINSLQQQLFYALVVQTFIPVILIHLPTTLMFLATLLAIDVGNYLALFSMSIALFTVLDPLPNFFIITPYRKAVLGYLKCRKPGEEDGLVRKYASSLN